MMGALATRRAADETVVNGVWTRRLRAAVDGADGSVTLRPAANGKAEVQARIGALKALPGVLARVRRVFDLAADPEAIARDLSADSLLQPLLQVRPGLRPAGDWIDVGEDAPSDRLVTRDGDLLARAERWRPWRAYGALYWTLSKELRHDRTG